MLKIATCVLGFCTVVACSPSTTPTGDDVVDMSRVATADQRQPDNYCGGNEKSKLWAQDCIAHCIPDEQIFFFCTEKRGKIAYTRQGLMVTQKYGYSLEIKTTSCQDVPVNVWQLVPLDPPPTNDNVGKMSASTVQSDCSAEPLKAPYVEMNLDRKYYVPVGPVPWHDVK